MPCDARDVGRPFQGRRGEAESLALRISIVAACIALAILPARAQQVANPSGYDLTGEWAPRFHEDQPERIPGPEIGDYLVRHGDYLTWIVLVDDPVYLTEPFIRTTNFALDPHQQIAPYPCQIVVEIDRPQGVVPHHLPGQNPFLNEFPAKYGVAPEAA